MTRRLRVALATITTTILATLLALPAAAAEEGAEAAGGFGTGDWDGMILVLAFGIVVGILMFFDSDPGGIPDARHH